MPNSELDHLASEILSDVLVDFRSKDLGSNALSEEYSGAPIAEIETRFCEKGGNAKIDFDLALKELEGRKLITTGPTVAYENTPSSGVFVLGLYSKREFLCLTEKGYKAALKKRKSVPSAARTPTVHISGGNFQNSPVAIGNCVSQATAININNDADVIDYLAKLHVQHNAQSGEKHRKEITKLVEAARKGDLPTAKPIFQRLFGAAKESTKALGWAVIAELIKRQLGI